MRATGTRNTGDDDHSIETMPRVSVVMPVFRGEQYLREALESVLRQTFTDIECIIICDEPTPETNQLLSWYENEDTRVRVISNPRRIGLIASLNLGCRQSRGEYIARMDADDIAEPERFIRQVQFLDLHPEVGVVGTQTLLIDGTGEPVRGVKLPTEPAVIRWHALFENCLYHPSVMIRKEVLEEVGYYNEEATTIEDFDLWSRIQKIADLANLPDPLLRYRINPGSITFNNLQDQKIATAEIQFSEIGRYLERDLTQREKDRLLDLFLVRPLKSSEDLDELLSLLDRILHGFLEKEGLSEEEKRAIQKDLSQQMLIVTYLASGASPLKRMQTVLRCWYLNPWLPATLVHLIKRYLVRDRVVKSPIA
jgi:glycosyltransferase involved in cell wall biosynthesis